MVSPFRTNANLGPNLHQVVNANQVWYEGAEQVGSPQTGDVSQGDDGRRYMWVEVAGSAIAVNANTETQVAITDNGADAYPRFTIATGSDGWYIGNQDTYEGVTSLPVGSRVWIAEGAALG